MEIVDYFYSFAAIAAMAYAVYWVVQRIKNKPDTKNIGGGKRPGPRPKPK